MLPNGKVLVTGGDDVFGNIDSTELYDPASGIWTAADDLNNELTAHTETLLLNGKVLVAVGTTAELYDIGLGFVRPDWQPQIATATSPLEIGTSLILYRLPLQGHLPSFRRKLPGLIDQLPRGPIAQHRQQPVRLLAGGSGRRLVRYHLYFDPGE